MSQSRYPVADYLSVTHQIAQMPLVRRLTRRARVWCRRRFLASQRVRELELVMTGAGMGSFEWDFATGKARVSPEMEALHGFSPGGFAGTWEALQALVHPDDREAMTGTFTRAAETGNSFETEFRTLRNGHLKWRSVVASVMRDDNGRPLRMVGVGRDITERHHAQEALAEAQSRYRRLVEQLPLATYVESLGTESAVYISPQIADLVGYTAEEWVANPNFFGNLLHADDRERVLAAFTATHRGGAPFDGEYRLTARDGRTVWVHDAAVLVHDDAGAPLCIQGYMIDITDRHNAETSLRQSQALQRRQMGEIEHQALHDSLTGLPNRSLFSGRIEHALENAARAPAPFAVMMIDLDRFKEINDTLGHQSGDRVLQEVGRRLRAVARSSDTVARLGGDEFGILAPGIASADGAERLAEKLVAALTQELTIGELALEVEASVGIALHPRDGVDVETLVRHADVAMYLSKETHHPEVYAPEHDHHTTAQLTRVADLRRALERGELVVYYQLQADAATRQVRGLEALLRWQHPTHGLLGPDQFIPLAERTGLIRQLTLFVLDAALEQCGSWRRQGLDLSIAVNITGRDLLDLGFPDQVAALLTKWDVAPAALELEITENTILTNASRARDVLDRLSALGVRLAIDDFGKGHSSLEHLARLPIDVLKIDRSFVMYMAVDSNAVIVRSTIDLAHNLGLQVVAEGVETEEAAAHLAALGCDKLQGFLLSRPVPAERLAGLIPALAKRRHRAA
jgi:diguanylate cyclase (GGDEF)-like protein/PAS domain S-box-containing protein